MQDEECHQEEVGKRQRRAALTPGPTPLRLHRIHSQSVPRALCLFDKISAQEFLVDSGADVSVIPRPVNEHFSSHRAFCSTLIAANGTKIPTFGTRTQQLSFDGLRTSHIFHIASVDRPILGADFFSKHGLAIDLSGRRLLRLPRDGSSFLSPLSTVSASPASTTLGVQGLHQPRRRSVDKLLDEFPTVLVSKYDPDSPPAHGISHTVPTSGPQCLPRPAVLWVINSVQLEKSFRRC